MSVASLNFLLFSAAAIALYQLALALPWRHARDWMFLAANLCFLATFAVGGWAGFLPMAGFIALGYAGIVILRHRQRPQYYWALLALTLASFFWLKKYTFVPGGLLLGIPYTAIGVSYMFFRIMQLLIDTESNDVEESPGPVSYLNYILNFTTLISGPIQRYQDFAAMQAAPRPLTWFACGRAIERIAIGMFKILILGGIIFDWHSQGLAALPAQIALADRAATGAQIVVGYTFFLYCNFSGYTDIVIGVARFLGIQLPENFNRPFSSLNFIEFWSRWHMTLSNWLKTYVYNPLAKYLMSRTSSPAADQYIGSFCFLVTFFLVGLWHGQTWVFALFGLIQGGGVGGNKLYQTVVIQFLGRKAYRALAAHWLYRALARGLTFTYFAFSLVCFWGSWPQITRMFGHLGWSGAAMAVALVFAGASVLLEIWERLRSMVLAVSAFDRPLILSRYVRTAWITALVLVTITVASLTATPAPDIVYKNF